MDRAALRARVSDARRDLRSALPALLERYWYAVVALVTASVEVYAVLRIRRGLGPTERVALGDSVIFEFIGIHLARGGRLYETIWEVKPPVSFEVTWLLATLFGERTYLYHAANIGVNVACVVGGAVLVAAFVREVTGDTTAGVVASVVPFVLARYYWRVGLGFKAKYLVVFFALLAIYLRLRDRPLGAGAASALAVGTWQLAVVVPLVTAVATLQRGDRRDWLHYAAGLVGVGLLVFLPVVWWGTVEEMVVETVFVPLLGTEDGGDAGPVQRLARGLGVTIPVFLLGLYGLVSTAWAEDRADAWPALAVGGWFLLAVLFVDYDTKNDLIPLFAFLAVGVGLLLGRARVDGTALSGLPPRRTGRRAVAVLVCGMALLSVVTFGGYGTGQTHLDTVETYDTTREMDIEMPYNLTERQNLFWHRKPAPTCRVFVGRTQYELVKRLGLAEADDVSYWEPACGQWEPTWRAVREKYGL